MKKYSIVALFLLIPVMFAGAEGFRHAEWGMTPEEVKESAREPLLTFDGDVYSVLGTPDTYIFDMQCVTLYFFSHKDRLVKGGFFFEPAYDSIEPYMKDLEKLEAVMKSIYGDGQKELLWQTDARYQPDEYGEAVSNGDLMILTHWETEGTYVELSLSSDDKGVLLMVQYFSRDLYDEYTEMLALKAESESGQRLGSQP